MISPLKTMKSQKSSQMKTISQAKNQSYYMSELSQKQSSNRNYNNSDIAQEILGLNQPNFMPSATFNPHISENTSQLTSYVHSQLKTDHRTLSVISIIEQKNYQNSALELHKARKFKQNADDLKIQKLESIGGRSINSTTVEPQNGSYLPQIVNVRQVEQRVSPFVQKIQQVQAQKTEKHLHLVSLVKMLGERTKSVSQPQTPHLQSIKEQLDMIPETPKSITRSNSVKQMLARVEDTLKKAGVGNIIKGIVTYHTTNQHQKPDFETLLRYDNLQNQEYSKSKIEEFLSPKSLLTLKNPFKQPKYLQQINYHVQDKSKFEPDKETADLLCQQFVKSIMGEDFVDPSQEKNMQAEKSNAKDLDEDQNEEEQDRRSFQQTKMSQVIRIQEKGTQDPQVDLQLNNALLRAARNQSTSQLTGDLTPRKLQAKVKVKPGQQVFSSAVLWNQQYRHDSPMEKTFLSQEGSGSSPFNVVQVQPQIQEKTKPRQVLGHETSGSSNFVTKPSQQISQIHLNLQDIDLQNENIGDEDQGELSPLGTVSEKDPDYMQMQFKETQQKIPVQAQVTKNNSKPRILNLAITNQQLFNRDISAYEESPSPRNDLSPFGPKKSIIDKSDLYKRTQEQKQQLLIEGKSPRQAQVRKLQNQSPMRGLSLVNVKNSSKYGSQITREQKGDMSPQSPNLYKQLSKNSLSRVNQTGVIQDQNMLDRAHALRLQSSLNLGPQKQQSKLNFNFENQLALKTGGVFGQSSAQDRTLQNIMSQSQLSADTKSLYSGDVSPKSDLKQSGLPSSYNGNYAEMELTTLAALENVQPDRIEIKIGQNNLNQQQFGNNDQGMLQMKKQEAIAFKLMQLVPERDSKQGLYQTPATQTLSNDQLNSNIKKSSIRKVISFQERNIQLQKLVVNTQTQQAQQNQISVQKIPETPLTIEGTPTQHKRPDQDSSSATKRIYSKFGRLQSDKNVIVLKKEQKAPGDLRILDRFAESAVVEEIQPWEENQKSDFQYTSDEDNFIPSSQIQAEVSSALPKQTRNKVGDHEVAPTQESQNMLKKGDGEQDQR